MSKEKDIDDEIENFIRDCDGKFSATAARSKQMSKQDAKLFDSIISEVKANNGDKANS